MPIVRNGDIVITTSMDTSGVEQGAEDITASMKKISDTTKKVSPATPQNASMDLGKIGSTLGKITKVIAESVAVGVFLIGAAIIGVIVSIGTALFALAPKILSWASKMYNELANSLFPFSTFYDKMLTLQTSFNNLRAAWLGVFANLLNAAMPVILNIVNWLTQLLNKLSMVIAALTGAKTALIGVGVQATHAGNAAKDMVAPFDKLNVLQQDNNLMQLKETPIDPEILASVERFKQLWNDVQAAALNTWIWITTKWGQFAVWFDQNIWKPISMWFIGNVWNPVINALSQFWQQIQPKLAELWNLIGSEAIALYQNILVPLWNQITTWFQSNWNNIVAIFQNSWNMIVDIVKIAWAWITGIINIGLDILTGRWNLALSDFRNTWVAMWNAIADFGKSAINRVIALLNILLNSYVGIINAVLGGINAIGGLTPNFTNIPNIPSPKIPYLATGAVIPPNAAFMAMLGDQSAGKNIETPESLLRQIMREELGNQNISINFNGSLSQLAKILKPEIDRENVRIGNNLIKRTGQVVIS